MEKGFSSKQNPRIRERKIAWVRWCTRLVGRGRSRKVSSINRLPLSPFSAVFARSSPYQLVRLFSLVSLLSSSSSSSRFIHTRPIFLPREEFSTFSLCFRGRRRFKIRIGCITYIKFEFYKWCKKSWSSSPSSHSTSRKQIFQICTW